VIDFAASAALNPGAFGSSDGLKIFTGVGDDPPFTIVDYSSRIDLQAAGFVSLTIDEFVHLSGNFAFKKGGEPVLVSLSDDPATTKQMSILEIGASNVNAFVGIGGPYWVDSNGDGVIDESDTPDAEGALGAALGNVEIALALLAPTTPDGTSYYAVRASGDVAIVGIDGFDLSAENLSIEVNGVSSPTLGAPAVDFIETFGAEGLPIAVGPKPEVGDAPTVNIDFTGPILRASGTVAMSIEGFVYLSGDFNFEKGDVIPTVSLEGTNGTKSNLNVLKIGGENISAFVGIGNPDTNDNGRFDVNDDLGALEDREPRAWPSRTWTSVWRC